MLSPMLNGQRCLLTGEASRLLAFWGTKTILAFQSVESDVTTFARPEDFTRLFEERVAPQNSRIWLAAVRSGDSLNYRAHTVLARGPTEGDADGFGASLILGHVAFYFLLGFSEPIRLRLDASVSPAFREIQPAPRETSPGRPMHSYSHILNTH